MKVGVNYPIRYQMRITLHMIFKYNSEYHGGFLTCATYFHHSETLRFLAVNIAFYHRLHLSMGKVHTRTTLLGYFRNYKKGQHLSSLFVWWHSRLNKGNTSKVVISFDHQGLFIILGGHIKKIGITELTDIPTLQIFSTCQHKLIFSSQKTHYSYFEPYPFYFCIYRA